MKDTIVADIICIDSEKYPVPVWNDLQTNSLCEHDNFEIRHVIKTYFKPDCVWNWDVLLNSKSDVLISISPDQHDFGIPMDLAKKYKKTIFINDEPIWSSSVYPESIPNHERDMKCWEPDIVYYCSKIDTDHSNKTNPYLAKNWNYCLDYLMPTRLPINKKSLTAIISCHPDGRDNGHTGWLGRAEVLSQIPEMKNIINVEEHIKSSYFHGTTDALRSSKICILPPHGLLIHKLRLFRAWYLGVLPVIVNPEGWLDRQDFNEAYKDLIDQDGKTCILVDGTNKIQETLKTLRDENYVDSLLKNIYNMDLTEYGHKVTWDDLYYTLSGSQ